MPFISINVTNRCTLKCKHCADLIPLINKPKDVDYVDLIQDIDKIFNSVDYIHRILLAGGELFLHPEIDKIIDKCINSKKIKCVQITTNGTIIPNDKILKMLSNKKVFVRVSNYGEVAKNRNKLLGLLKYHNINYDDCRNQKWSYMGELNCRNRTKRQLEKVFNECEVRHCIGLHDGKIHLCTRSAVGVKLNIVPKDGKDYINIRTASSNIIRKRIGSLYNKDYIQACNFCDGINSRSKKIPAGVQIKTNSNTEVYNE
jgi:organic radical activating enzyme